MDAPESNLYEGDVVMETSNFFSEVDCFSEMVLMVMRSTLEISMRALVVVVGIAGGILMKLFSLLFLRMLINWIDMKFHFCLSSATAFSHCCQNYCP